MSDVLPLKICGLFKVKPFRQALDAARLDKKPLRVQKAVTLAMCLLAGRFWEKCIHVRGTRLETVSFCAKLRDEVHGKYHQVRRI